MDRVLDFITANWKSGFEILLLTAVIYYLLVLVRGTRGAAVLTGFVTALVAIVAVTHIFQLEVINWILSRVLALLAVAALVIFQPELRKALAQLGSQQFFGSGSQSGQLIDVLVETAVALSQKRFGALLAVERDVGFRGIVETGVRIDAPATKELLLTIFFPNTPLHDGGVVLRGDRILAAGCIFPLTQREGLAVNVGMRHRAAIGLTEETDAILVVVSEETGQISVAQRGHLVQDMDEAGLRAFLRTTLTLPPQQPHWFREWVRRAVNALMLPRSATENNPEAGPGGFASDTAPVPPPGKPPAQTPSQGEK